MLSTFVRTVVATCIMAFAVTACADDSYYRVKIKDLKFVDAADAKFAEGIGTRWPDRELWRTWQRYSTMLALCRAR